MISLTPRSTLFPYTTLFRSLGVNAGLGSIAKGGYDYSQVNSVTNSNAWLGDNRMVEVIPFRPADTTFENVYFKNPGEKTAVDKDRKSTRLNSSHVKISYAVF